MATELQLGRASLKLGPSLPTFFNAALGMLLPFSHQPSRLSFPFRRPTKGLPAMGSWRESLPFSRRDAILLTSSVLATAVASLSSCFSLAAPFPMVEAPDLPRFRKTASGVRIQEVVEGDGTAATIGDLVEFNYVCRRSNGYFVHSTVDQFSGESSPVTLPLEEGKIIPGLSEVLTGMKPGGKRRALIPPEVGYIQADLEPQPTEFGPRRSLYTHMKEPLIFEVQLLKVK